MRGVMGYEGRAVLVQDRAERSEATRLAMEKLRYAREQVGGEVVSAGGTGTFDLNPWATEIQAGSYSPMDTEYAKLGPPFREALTMLATVISVSEGFAVADAGLKALAMDHGNPAIDGARVWFCSDEHATSAPEIRPRPSDRVRIRPAHVDPTVAKHSALHLVESERVVDVWPVELRGW